MAGWKKWFSEAIILFGWYGLQLHLYFAVYGAYCNLLARSIAMSHIAWQKKVVYQSKHSWAA
jgi:hypothetical protein